MFKIIIIFVKDLKVFWIIIFWNKYKRGFLCILNSLDKIIILDYGT